MKAIKLFFILFIATLAVSSCHKEEPTPTDTVINSVNDLVVPADFKWNTTQTISVSVNLPVSGDIQPLILTNREGTVKYFRGYPENDSRTVNTKITIPTYVNEVRLTYSGVTGPNMVLVSNGTLTYDLNNTTKSVISHDECDLSGFKTFSKGGWGTEASGNNPGSLRDQHFDQVYPGNFVVGDPAHYKITFSGSVNVENYLPGGGGPAVLTQNWTNPVQNNRLGNMADQIIAARLNRDFNEAGYLGTNPDFKLGELVFVDGAFANMSIDDFLAMAEIALGGGDLHGHTAAEYSNAAEKICLSFESDDDKSGGEGSENEFTCPTNSGSSDPFIELSSDCVETDVIFTISNTGDGPMTSAKNYTVYKNNVQIASGTYQLGVNQTLDLTAAGFDTDEFKLVVVPPTGANLQEVLSGCGEHEGDDDDETDEQLAGSLAYEDLWPGKGDYDFNDLIIDYDFVVNKNGQEMVQNITATFVVKAFGASYHNGFGFTFPNVAPSDIVSVSGCNIENTATFSIANNGVENGQSKATIIVFDDARRIMPQTTPGVGVNTQLDYDFIDPVTIVVNITFANNAVTYSELNIGDFNPFLVVQSDNPTGGRGLEIHLPYYEPSDLFDESYFGQLNDDSDPSVGRYFVTENNLPWAINIAHEFDWVIEFQDITGAYNFFAEWAQSGGINYPNWYLTNSGYRNNAMIYPTQIVP